MVCVVALGLMTMAAAGLVFARRKHRVDRASTGNSVVVVDSSGQPCPLHSTIEQQLANHEVFAVPMESNRMLTTSARQSLATGTLAAPVYRAIGEVRYGCSDFTAPSVPYDVLARSTPAVYSIPVEGGGIYTSLAAVADDTEA